MLLVAQAAAVRREQSSVQRPLTLSHMHSVSRLQSSLSSWRKTHLDRHLVLVRVDIQSQLASAVHSVWVRSNWHCFLQRLVLSFHSHMCWAVQAPVAE